MTSWCVSFVLSSPWFSAYYLHCMASNSRSKSSKAKGKKKQQSARRDPPVLRSHQSRLTQYFQHKNTPVSRDSSFHGFDPSSSVSEKSPSTVVNENEVSVLDRSRSCYLDCSGDSSASFVEPIEPINSLSEESVDSVAKMTDRSTEPEGKNPEWIFTGNMYACWKERLMALFAKEKLRDLFRESADETKYRALNPKERESKMGEYDDRQWRARVIIYDRLDTNHLDRIRQCITVRDIMEKLDREHESKSLVSQIRHRSRYYNFKFKGGDLKEYVLEHEKRAQQYQATGAELGDRERVLQLHTSLPPIYDSAIDSYRSLQENLQTYEGYREILLEKFERMSLMGNSSSNNKKNAEIRDKSEDEALKVPDPEKDHPVKREFKKRCYNCSGYGHESRVCPSPRKGEKDEEKVAAVAETPSVPATPAVSETKSEDKAPFKSEYQRRLETAIRM